MLNSPERRCRAGRQHLGQVDISEANLKRQGYKIEVKKAAEEVGGKPKNKQESQKPGEGIPSRVWSFRNEHITRGDMASLASIVWFFWEGVDRVQEAEEQLGGRSGESMSRWLFQDSWSEEVGQDIGPQRAAFPESGFGFPCQTRRRYRSGPNLYLAEASATLWGRPTPFPVSVEQIPQEHVYCLFFQVESKVLKGRYLSCQFSSVSPSLINA